MRGLIYLAGSIAGISGKQATGWRTEATNYFSVYGIDVRDPMRAKHVLADNKKISRDYNDYVKKGTFYTSRAIMTRDFNDVKQSDLLLVNLLGAKQPSLGTIMELAWAYALQKPAVVVIESKGNPHDNHPMLHESMGFRLTTLAEGLRAAAVILGVPNI